MSFKFLTFLSVAATLLFVAVMTVMIHSPTAFSTVAEGQGASNEETGGEHSVVRTPAAAGRNGVSRKRYPGGADEDDLQVQSTLPIPARNYDGTSTTAAMASDSLDSENPAPPPAND